MTDPRTDLLQCLEAVLTAELVDNDCWRALIELTEAAGHANLAKRFRRALEHEREHLDNVRRWVAAGTGRAGERSQKAGTETGRRPMRATADASRASSAGSRGRRRASRTATAKSGRARGTASSRRKTGRNPRGKRQRSR